MIQTGEPCVEEPERRAFEHVRILAVVEPERDFIALVCSCLMIAVRSGSWRGRGRVVLLALNRNAGGPQQRKRLRVSIARSSNLYAANFGGANVRKFSPTGVDLGIFASAGLVGPRDVVVVPPGGPATKDECKDGGWESFDFPRTFKNQGDCVQFIETGK